MYGIYYSRKIDLNIKFVKGLMSTDDEHEDNDEINIEICGKICDSKY